MPGAVVIESPSVRRILDHISEPSTPPGISPCRGPPDWEEKVELVFLDEVVVTVAVAMAAIVGMAAERL